MPAIAASLAVTVKNSNSPNEPLADAVVYAVPATKPAARASVATIAQFERRFVPAVSVVQTGASISFPNRDSVRHHVYSFSPAKTFELKLYAGTPADPVTFDKPGLVTLGCNIHDRMLAYVAVVDTPYFAKSDEAGNAVIDGLPAGDYAVHAWHPRGGPLGDDSPVRLNLAADARRSFEVQIAAKPQATR